MGSKSLPFALLVCLIVTNAGHPATNLVTNGSLDSINAQMLPDGWEPLSIGSPATIVSDPSQQHGGGGASLRIDAPDITRSYLRSTNAIEVAPGEAIEAAAWVKIRDVPPDTGSVIMIAEFTSAAAAPLSVEKFATLDLNSAGQTWQHISGSVKVPPNASRLHLRLGLSYSRGTCWWDDVTVTARQPLVCRIDLPQGRLAPAMDGLPLTMINRERRRGPVTAAAQLGQGKLRPVQINLSGEPLQQSLLPLPVLTPGKSKVTATLFNDTTPIFADARLITIPPPIALLMPSPTHFAVEDGVPVIEGRLELAIAREALAASTVTIDLRNAAGDVVPRAATKLEHLRDGINEFTFKLPTLPTGDYAIRAQLETPGRAAISSDHRAWHVIDRRQASVTLNAAGFPESDGKAIFPLGIFNGAKFKAQADAGFTVTHAYNAVRIDENGRDADDRALSFLDATGSNGMKMLFMVPMKQVIRGDFEAVRRRVRMFRNHPALLAWDEEEGFARGDFKPDTLQKLRALLLEEDPHHPFMVGDSKDVITRISKERADFFPVDQMDLGMWWWYPFPLRQREGDALLGEDASRPGSELVPPSFLLNASTRKPLWVGVQSYKKPGDQNRYPTPVEYRAQAYLAIVHGAKGLMWYGGSVTGGLFLKPDEGHWPDLQSLVRELRDRSDVLMSPSDPPPAIVPHDAPVSAAIKNAPGGKVLIAVNRSAKSIEVTISGRRVKLDAYEVFISE